MPYMGNYWCPKSTSGLIRFSVTVTVLCNYIGTSPCSIRWQQRGTLCLNVKAYDNTSSLWSKMKLIVVNCAKNPQGMQADRYKSPDNKTMKQLSDMAGADLLCDTIHVYQGCICSFHCLVIKKCVTDAMELWNYLKGVYP